MACVNALCRRLKRIFSSSSNTTVQTSATEVKDNLTEDELPITVNPFAPIEQVDFIKVEDVNNTVLHDKGKSRFKG